MSSASERIPALAENPIPRSNTITGTTRCISTDSGPAPSARQGYVVQPISRPSSERFSAAGAASAAAAAPCCGCCCCSWLAAEAGDNRGDPTASLVSKDPVDCCFPRNQLLSDVWEWSAQALLPFSRPPPGGGGGRLAPVPPVLLPLWAG